MTRTSKRPPQKVPVLVSSDFCKESLKKGSVLCLVGWFRKIFCHEDEACYDARKENPDNKTINPVMLSWVPVPQSGFSLKKEYKSWRAKALQALIKECKKIDRHSQYPAFAKNEKYVDHLSILAFNDSLGRKKETLAKVWNRTMAQLGYVSGNPEAK